MFLIMAFTWLFLLFGANFLAAPKMFFTSAMATPRTITPRGEFTPDEKNTIDIFNTAKDSVVYITTLNQVVDYWTRNIMEFPSGTGSGFVWDSAGHIVTNYHVIKGAQSAIVRLHDQRSFQATLIGVSTDHDLAVLKIIVPEPSPKPVLIGTSKDLLVGQKVYAIGNPFGLDHTLTTGVISALNRSLGLESTNEIRNLIQTDAAINPGNSGGPLLDSAGRLIGVNTAIYSPSGAYAGVGFAVPVETVNRVVPQLIAYGKYFRPSIGIIVDDEISQMITKQLNIQGVLILQVEPNSAAARAGIRGTKLNASGSVLPGDIIQRIDDKIASNISDIYEVLERYKVGDKISLEIVRGSDRYRIELILESGRN